MDATTPQDAFYARMDRLSFQPGWRPRPASLTGPRLAFEPEVWRWSDARAALDEAGEVVTTEEAERRNLVLTNRVNDALTLATRNITAAYQMVKPGERARSHRHTPAALRLVVDTRPGMYTVVDGVRIDMAPGDVVLTPSWCWHGHANESERNGYWIDFLDVPFVNQLGAAAFEPYPEPYETVRESQPRSPYRIQPDQVFSQARSSETVEIGHGLMPTFSLHLSRYRAGTQVELGKSAISNLYSLTGGRARFVVEGGLDVTLSPGDILSVPAWHQHSLDAQEETTFLRVSDEAIFKALGLSPTVADARAGNT
jgi:gentisate 1,2-dioxygenase